MKAIILAAGFSTRLYPLTKLFPKGLLPVDGKAIVDFMLGDLLNTQGIDEMVMVTNKLYFPLFNTWLKTYYKDSGIELVSDETVSKDDRLGAIGDLQFILDKKGWSDDLVILPSDTLTSVKIADLVNFFHKNRGVVNVLYDTQDKDAIKNRLGCAVVDGNKITQFVEKPEDPPTTLTSVPYYIYPKEVLSMVKNYIEEGGSVDAPGSIISWFLSKTSVFGYKIEGYYYDVGTVEVYNQIAEKKNF